MPGLFGTPAVGNSGDGRFEIFVIGQDSALWHIYQTAWSNGWSRWSVLGGPWGNVTEPPAVGSSGDGRLELYVAAGTLQHAWQTAYSNGWSGFVNEGSPSPIPNLGFFAPAIAPNADGRLELFVAANGLFRKEQTAWSNGWTDWLPHDNPPEDHLVGPVFAGRSGDGRVEAFTVGEHGTMWNVRQTAPAGAWSGWNSFGSAGGGFDDRPTFHRSADGRLELFVRGGDGHLWHRWQLAVSTAESWSGWADEGVMGGGLENR